MPAPPSDVIAGARQLADALDDGDVAICPVPRGLAPALRAQALDLVTAAVAELRETRDVGARTISGQALDLDDAEMVFVVWEGARPEFFDDDEAGGRR